MPLKPIRQNVVHLDERKLKELLNQVSQRLALQRVQLLAVVLIGSDLDLHSSFSCS
jgi:hypothetical protein